MPRTIPVEELNKFFHAIYGHLHQSGLSTSQYKNALRDTAIIELLFATGVRVSELCHLPAASVNCAEGVVKIYEKSKSERMMHIENAHVLEILREYSICFSKEMQTYGYFFINRNGQRFSEQSSSSLLTLSNS